MKKVLIPLMAVMFAVTSAVAAPESYKIDTAHSTVSFRVKHFGVSWVRGSFDEFNGSVNFDENNPEKSSVEVIVKADSIDTGNSSRDGHLKTEDFFNTGKFPTLTFKSTNVKKVSDTTYEVTGDFTMHGVTKPLIVKFESLGKHEGKNGEVRRGGETSFTVKRSDFGMSGSIPVVGDNVEVTLAFAGVKK